MFYIPNEVDDILKHINDFTGISPEHGHNLSV